MNPRQNLASLLPRFSVNRPITVLMILCTILVVGYIANTRIPVALFPEGMDEKNLGVFVPYGNASARDIEETIARPVEGAIGTISGVQRMRSYITSGRVFVRVGFNKNTDLKQAYADLSDRMERVKPDLPDDVERIYVRRWDENDIPIIYLVVSFPESIGDPYTALETLVQPAIQRVEGVGNVEAWGIERNQVRIDLLEDRMRSHRIDPNQLVRDLRSTNFTLASGFVYEGGSKIYVRSDGRMKTLEEIRNIPIDASHRLTLGDIAEINFRPADRDWAYRVDQIPSIGIEITRESTGNIEQISTDVRAALTELVAMPQLAGMTYDVFWDQGDHVRDSINNLRNTGLWGGLFAALVIFAFLRAPRLTGILTMAIPLSLLCTVIMLYFVGWSLNMATMMGLLLSVGLVVDNAIVIVENIYRHKQAGLRGKNASITGAGEVGLAVTMATLTTVVVFLPLILMSGEAEFSFWMLRIGMPVITSLLASLFIALVFVPLAAQRLSRAQKQKESKILAWVNRKYSGLLRRVLTHRLEASLIVIAAMATIMIPISNIETDDQGGGDDDNAMRFQFEMPSGNTLEQTEAFVRKVETYLVANREKYNFGGIESRLRGPEARVQARFLEDPYTEWYEVIYDTVMTAVGKHKVAMTEPEIETDFRKNFFVPPGIRLRTQDWDRDARTNGRLTLSLYGDDTASLMRYAEEMKARLITIPHVLGVETSMERGDSELLVQVDRDRAHELGVDPRDISGTISSSIRGIQLDRFYDERGREIQMFVGLKDAKDQDMDDLRSMTFTTESGVEVPLESVAKLEVHKTLGQIRREDRETTLSVSISAPQNQMGQLYTQVDEALKDFQLPRGYRWDKGSRYFRNRDSNEEQKFAMILAIAFVFLLMGVLFESFILPLAVIIAVPFSFLGVYWMLFITGTKMNMMAMIGMVILIGVVVNNAIVLVDLTNRLRAEGMARFQALIQAGQHRLRPILMTTCTTICGLIPMALGRSDMVGMPYAPMGRAMIGGLLASTVLTLIVVPLFYLLLDELRDYAGKVARSAWSKTPDSRASTVAQGSGK